MPTIARSPDPPAAHQAGERIRPRTPILLSLALALTACGDEDSPIGGAPPARHDTRLELVAEGLDFPVHLTQLPGGPVFVVEKGGTVRRLTPAGPEPTPFLDLSDQVSGGSEQGLLSLAFHPQVVANRRFFVSYTDRQGDSQVVEYALGLNDGDPPQRIGTILSVDQPFANHNGGHILFGPDGMFYFGLGDGGGAGDPNENAQNLGSLLGKLLRLDLERSAPYGIPAGNPFVDSTGARPEIWAYGLRNPWRFTFDRATGDLYIADVGQNAREEVDVMAAGSTGGENYGWDLLEGTRCFEPRQNCQRPGLVAPVLEYNHDSGCSITGGFVYRGAAVPAIAGHYFYADYCAGFVRSFRWIGGITEEASWPDLSPPAGRVTAFGEDEAGELYILSNHGEVYRVVAANESPGAGRGF